MCPVRPQRWHWIGSHKNKLSEPGMILHAHRAYPEESGQESLFQRADHTTRFPGTTGSIRCPVRLIINACCGEITLTEL